MSETTKKVELSLCHRAQVVVVKRPSVRWLEPDDLVDVCSACGKPCDPVEFIQNDDGTLTDPETGETGLEETPGRSEILDEGPDPDEAYDRWRDDHLV